MTRDTYIIMPVYNEELVVRDVINNVLENFQNVICVDDGSHDKSLREIMKTKGALVGHPINLGQGAALQTGIEYALLDNKAKYFVTFDSDGQHRVDDVKKMLRVIKKENLDLVLGSRFLGGADNISLLKRAVLKSAVKFSNATTGVRLTDAHNGLRVFNRKFAENLKLTMPDMTHATEFVHRIAEGKYKYKEVPVTIRYTDYSRKKGQSMLNAVNISFDLILHKITKR